MKIKIISIFLIITILLGCCMNVVNAAFSYDRTGGEKLSDVVPFLTDETWIAAKYRAENLPVTANKVHIYDYNTTNNKTCSTSDVIYSDSTKSQYGLYTGWGAVAANNKLFKDDSTLIYYAVKFESGEHEYNNVATFVYDNAIKYNNKIYNIKLNIKSMKVKSSDNIEGLMVLLGSKKKEEDKTREEQSRNISDYDREEVYPFIELMGKQENTTDDKMEVDLEYFIVDSQGNETPISGVFGAEDIDYNQGIYIDGVKPNNQGSQKATNIYMREEDTQNKTHEEIKYKTDENGMYVYTTYENNRNDDYHDVYVLIDNKSKIPLTYTFDKIAAGSPLCFIDEELKYYKTITTEVIGGTIDPSIINIKDGENKTINYTPNQNYYLKSITVDGTPLTNEQLVTYKNGYTFSNITENHTIKVEYAEKLKVEFDPKGGTPTPDTQYVEMNGNATKPTDPTKTGYTFDSWLDSNQSPYNFNTPVTENKLLTAKWNPINYNLKYVLNGGTRHAENIDRTFTIEDTIDFKSPTKEGYDFGGWYTDPDFTTKKDGISHESEDVTVYAKWTPILPSEAAYKVQHYKETSNGNYELVDTENLTGETGSTATATPKTYTGYKENTTYPGRVPTGTITGDGNLVLKLYYSKNAYRVTFDPKGGTPKPENQTVKYNDKATKPSNPTKEGYTFEGWYYIDNGKEVKYNFDDPVTHDVDLIAKWQAKSTPTPTKEDNTTIKTKTGDTTVAKTALPFTGKTVAFIIFVMIGIAVVIGRKYFGLKNMLK